MPATVSITETDVFTAVRAFLTTILAPSVVIIRGQANRAAAPKSANYVVMASLRRGRLATNTETWDHADPDPDLVSSTAPTRVTLQLDVHGDAGADNAQIISTLFRSSYGCAQLALSEVPIQPLEISDPHQTPFLNGEAQYEDRWSVDVSLQINPVVTTPQEFADALVVVPVDVDATYPPGGS